MKTVSGRDGSDWYLVSSYKPEEIYGYIRSDFIVQNGVGAESISVNSAMETIVDDVKVYSFPSLSGNVLLSLPYHSSCKFQKAVFDSSSGYYWYLMSFNKVDGVDRGYIRSDYFSSDEFSDTMSAVGFPESYAKLLNKIHALYPNWTFEAYDPAPDIDWASAVNAQKGISVVEDLDAASISEIETDKKKISEIFETTLNGSSFPDAGLSSLNSEASYAEIQWTQATDTALRYYMDPRNFMLQNDGSLNSSFFMFMDGRETGGCTEAGIEKILSTTSMKGNIPNESVTYSSLVKSISDEKKLNPYLVAARMRQEHGSSTPDGLISGTYPGYEGYYNYFNIGANGSEPIVNGLKYAMRQGWNSRRKSIAGGIAFLADNYVYNTSYYQNTLYKQRFNFKAGNAAHQYMTSLYAPHYEARHVRQGYQTADMGSLHCHFLIPVYKNMTDTPVTAP
ncbi:MAG: hypothetical protein J6O55_01065 [Lachnospiraceae bacterium]|nr:hypothetical protein [Lachnospiraceae bacterium]